MIYGCLKDKFIKHKYAKDVCYYVKNISKVNNDIKYTLEIWNMGFENSWKIDECKAENLDIASFLLLTGERKDCLRYCTWSEISL